MIRPRILYRALAAALAALGAGQAMAQSQPSAASSAWAAGQEAAAWQRVRQALTPEQQAAEVRAFLQVLAQINARPTLPAVDARDIAGNRVVALDDPAILQRPQSHELTLTIEGRFYTFRPLSRASVEPLFGR